MVWWIQCERCDTLVDEFETEFVHESLRLCRSCATEDDLKEFYESREGAPNGRGKRKGEQP